MNNPHDYLITTTSPPPPRPVDPDNPDSWVMLNESGFVKLGNERVLLKLDSRISCDLTVPAELRPRCTSFSRKSDRGTLFLTNKRVGLVFVCTYSHSSPTRLYIYPPKRLKSPNLNHSAPPSSSSRTRRPPLPCGGDGRGSQTSRPSRAGVSRLIFLASRSNSPFQTAV